MAGKIPPFSTMTTRQILTAVIFVLIMLFLLWQVYKMFGASRRAPRPASTVARNVTSPATPGVNPGSANPGNATPGPGSATPGSPTPGATTAPAQAQPITPEKAQLIKPEAPLTPEDQALLKLQQETQAKYLTAVSELQMLRVARDIAEANQAIMTARLSAVTSQKKIVDMLSPPPPPPEPAPAPPPPAPVVPLTPAQQRALLGRPSEEEEVKYVVVSVAQIQYRWSAVLGAKGILYNVRVGDILPLDNSRVINIDRSGVVLQRRGVRRRLSLVPII